MALQQALRRARALRGAGAARLRGAGGAAPAARRPCAARAATQDAAPVPASPPQPAGPPGAEGSGVQPKGATAEEALRLGSERLVEYVRQSSDRTQPVVRLKSPDELKAAFRAAGCSLDLADQAVEVDVATLLDGLDCILEHTVNTAHPLFFNQLYSKGDPLAILGDWVAAATNTNVHTYEVAPVYTVMEAEVLAKLARLLGGAYAAEHDGLLVPGGSIANLYGMQLARDRKDPEWKARGMNGGPRLVAFTSEHSHYSYKKSAMLIGLGTDNLVGIPTDASGAMRTDALEAAIVEAAAEGRVPFFVGATAGTTVRGGYDRFDEVADVCARHGLWMHIDGAWGGGALLSAAQRPSMRGAERADSFCWNPHKMLGATLQVRGAAAMVAGDRGDRGG